MKFKSLLLTAAITAASFSSVANAAIDGVTPVQNIFNSDLILVISDSALNLGYVQVLDGFNYNTIVASAKAGTFSGSFNLDAAALSIFAGSDRSNLSWSVAAASVDDNLGEVSGNIMTSASAYEQDSTTLSIVGSKFANLAIAVNQNTAIGTGALAASGGAGSAIATEAAIWNNQVSGSLGTATSATPDVAQHLWYASTDVDFMPVAPSIASYSAWVLDLDAKTLVGAGAPVAETPLPAAAWLMVSALMGLGGIARRRNAKV